MIRPKRSRALQVGSTLVVSMVAALVGCGASNDAGESASSTAAALSYDLDGCGAPFLADAGVGFYGCPNGGLCSAEGQLEAQLNAEGCRLCVNVFGTRVPVLIEKPEDRVQYEWWCAVCPLSEALTTTLENTQFTPKPLGVRAVRWCHGTETVPHGDELHRELLVEWDPRCPGGACQTAGGGGT